MLIREVLKSHSDFDSALQAINQHTVTKLKQELVSFGISSKDSAKLVEIFEDSSSALNFYCDYKSNEENLRKNLFDIGFQEDIIEICIQNFWDFETCIQRMCKSNEEFKIHERTNQRSNEEEKKVVVNTSKPRINSSNGSEINTIPYQDNEIKNSHVLTVDHQILRDTFEETFENLTINQRRLSRYIPYAPEEIRNQPNQRNNNPMPILRPPQLPTIPFQPPPLYSPHVPSLPQLPLPLPMPLQQPGHIPSNVGGSSPQAPNIPSPRVPNSPLENSSRLPRPPHVPDLPPIPQLPLPIPRFPELPPQEFFQMIADDPNHFDAQFLLRILGSLFEPTGLSSEQINSLQKQKISSIKEIPKINNCVICFEDFEIGSEIAVLKCEHPFHSECISTWLENSCVCPLCKSDVS